MTTDDGKDLADIQEMDAIFRRADFVAESPGLEERLWGKIQAKLTTQDMKPFAAERELSEDELLELAAAGAPEAQGTETLRRVWRQNERGL